MAFPKYSDSIRDALPHPLEVLASRKLEFRWPLHPLPTLVGIFRSDFVVGSTFEFAEVHLGERVNCQDWAGPLTSEYPGALEAPQAWARVNGREWLLS